MKKFIFFLISLLFVAANAAAQMKHETPVKEVKHSLQPAGPFWWTCDSTYYSIWEPTTSSWSLYEKEYTTLNGQGYMTERLYVEWDETLSQWVNGARYRKEYYDDQSTRSSYREVWNSADNLWVDLDHYLYDPEGKVTEIQSQTYNSATHLITSGSRYTYTYNVSSTVVLYENLDVTTMLWHSYFRTTDTYNPDGKISERLVEDWDETGLVWANSERTTFTYTVSGDLQTEEDIDWDEITLTWVPYSKKEYYYNSSNLLESTCNFYWNSIISSWDNAYRDLYDYNTAGHPVLSREETWNSATSVWDKYSMMSWVYFDDVKLQSNTYSLWNPLTSQYIDLNYYELDTSGNEINYFYKYIDFTTYELTGGYQYLYTFENDRPNEALHQNLNISTMSWEDVEKRIWAYDGNFNCTTETDMKYNAGLWENWFLQQHYYSDFIGINEHLTPQDYCLFSNPISSGTTIRCDALKGKPCSVRLINMNGQVIYSTNVYSGTVTFPSVAAGEYILQLIPAGEKPVSGKVLVK